MKIRPVEAEFFLAEGRTDGRRDIQTDMRKLKVAFRNFAHAPTSGKVKYSNIQNSTCDCCYIVSSSWEMRQYAFNEALCMQISLVR